ncbi:hypothetical protein FB45DRAFT_931660 [Roridomyces roridus]|uniref:Transmembrane protein n=1 Tax=Roridomyces roridus TaxID=1738132 RepID=A0AAD7FDZ7_9AGAR|nr:hypothetical protein FB45DRAFT_931660 [Roridomyces roridus]
MDPREPDLTLLSEKGSYRLFPPLTPEINNGDVKAGNILQQRLFFSSYASLMNFFSSLLVFFTLCARTSGMSVPGPSEEHLAWRLSVKEAKSLWRRAPQAKNLLTITLIVGIVGATALVAALILGILLLVRRRRDRRQKRVSNPAFANRRIRLPESTVPTVSESSPHFKEQPFPATPESPRRPPPADPLQLDRVEPLADTKPAERQFKVSRKQPPTPLPTELGRDVADSAWFSDSASDIRRLEGTITRKSPRSQPIPVTESLPVTPADTVSSPSQTRGSRRTPSESKSRGTLSKSSVDRTLPHSTTRGHRANDSGVQPPSPVRDPDELVSRSPPLTPLPRTSTRPKLVLPPEPVPAHTRDVPTTTSLLLQTPPLGVSSRFSVSPVSNSFGSRINSPGSPSSTKRHTRLFGSFSGRDRTRRGEGKVPGVPDVPTDVR